MTSSAVMASKSRSGSWGGLLDAGMAKKHLLERVAAEPEPERLERDDLVRGDVPEVHLGPEVLDEPRLRALRRRLPDQVVEVERVLDLVHETCAQLAVRAINAGGAALTTLGDDLPGARVELLAHPLHPQVGRNVHLRVLRADLGENDEVVRKLGDQLELALARDLERPIGDLDVRETEVLEPALEIIDLVLREDGLEERASADHRSVEGAVERDLLLEIVRDVARAPAELHDVDVCARGVEEAFDLAQVQSLVDDMREAPRARLPRAGRDVEERGSVKGVHRCPPTSGARVPAHRGRGSCRGRRCRRSAG